MKFIISLTGRLIAVALALIMPTLWVSAYGAPSVGSYILGTSVDYSANPAIQYMKFKVLSANTCTVTKNASGIYDDIAELTGNLVVPSSITYDGTEYKVVELESYGFSYLTGITSATVSEGITTLGHHSFAESENLESLSLPSTLQSVAELSSYEWQLHIYNCLKVKSITIADGKAYVAHIDGSPIAQFSTSNIEVQPSVEINSTLQMQSNLGDDITFDEAFRSKEENKGYKFYRYDSANDKFVECGLTDVCPTSQCYLKADDLIMTAELNVEHDNKVTGIDGITEDEPVYEIYDLQGRKVTGNLSTGIYIINGKKRFVRQ